MKGLKGSLLTLFLLGFGVFMLYGSLGDQRAFNAMLDHGNEAMADMAAAVRYDKNNRPSYTVELSWTGAGGERLTYPPTHISPAFWSQIMRGNAQIVAQTKIRYLRDNPTARPVIVADMEERHWQDGFGVKAGFAFLAAGIVAGFFLLRR